jgi:hypothetical protein
MITGYENKAISTRDRHQNLMVPPKVEGRTCLQVAFGSNDGTAENVARALGFEITEHPVPGYGLRKYIPDAAVGLVLGTLRRWSEENREAKRITPEHVSCRVLDAYLRFDTARVAHQVGCPVLEPSVSERFLLLDDIGLVIEAQRQSPPYPPHACLDPGVEDRVTVWVREHQLAGKTAVEIRRERLIPHYNI